MCNRNLLCGRLSREGSLSQIGYVFQSNPGKKKNLLLTGFRNPCFQPSPLRRSGTVKSPYLDPTLSGDVTSSGQRSKRERPGSRLPCNTASYGWSVNASCRSSIPLSQSYHLYVHLDCPNGWCAGRRIDRSWFELWSRPCGVFLAKVFY